jgi:hypothetical protein
VKLNVVVITSTRKFNEVPTSSRCMLVVKLKTKKKKSKSKLLRTLIGFSNGIEKKKLKKKLPQR